jgi:peptidoglycan/xylan/chitin deacetylase (PgdA/CDA1 family)
MIYITGDVHAKIKGNWEQEKAGSELDAAKEFLEILKKHKLSCTLFINGKCLEENPAEVKNLVGYDTELGGHTYDNFGNLTPIRSFINRKKFGCVYGSEKFQKKDIEKTKKAFQNLGFEMKSWRTHAFGSNSKTIKILKENGVSYISDLTGDIKPHEESGIIHLPINIPADVNTIAYGEYSPENKNPFASCVKGRIKPEEWLEIVKKRITGNEKKNIPSILLIHPITMKVLDNFGIFEELAKFLSKYKSEKMSGFKL